MAVAKGAQIFFFLTALCLVCAGSLIVFFMLKPVTRIESPVTTPIDGNTSLVEQRSLTIETSVQGRCMSLAFGLSAFLEVGDCGSLRFSGSWLFFPQTKVLIYRSTSYTVCVAADNGPGSRVLGAPPDTEACEGVSIVEDLGFIKSKTGLFLGLQQGNTPIWVPEESQAIKWNFRFGDNKEVTTTFKISDCGCNRKYKN